jgi:opacity protein-like surface antigen
MRPSFPAVLAIACLSVAGVAASPAAAQDDRSLFGSRTASVTIGPYLRFELGQASPTYGGAYWHSPGYDPVPGVGDPEVRFSLSGDSPNMGTIAYGHDWQGWRAEVALSRFGKSTASGPCSSASDGSSCSTHATIDEALVSTTSVMGNVYYAPLEARGSNSVFQPFIVGGLGLAQNSVDDWTRSNPLSTRPFRTFSGATTTSLAWSIGVGASYQVTRPGKWPVLIEASWRYYNLGSAEGGAVPLPGNGSEEPLQPLTFDVEQSVIAIGVRIPLQRY